MRDIRKFRTIASSKWPIWNSKCKHLNLNKKLRPTMRNRTSKEFYNNIYMKDNKDCMKLNNYPSKTRPIKEANRVITHQRAQA